MVLARDVNLMLLLKDSASVNVDIQRGRILRRLGYREHDPSASILSVVSSQITEAYKLIKPVYAYELRGIEGLTEQEVTLKGPLVFSSRVVSYVLSDCKWVVICLATIGKDLGERIARQAESGKKLEVLVLDAIGTEAVLQISYKLQDRIKEMTEANGYQATIRYGPGYCDWHLSQQKVLLQVMDSASFGVELTESFIMKPLKSISGVIGIGHFAVNKLPPCLAVCDIRSSCTFKRVNWNPEKKWLL